MHRENTALSYFSLHSLHFLCNILILNSLQNSDLFSDWAEPRMNLSLIDLAAEAEARTSDSPGLASSRGQSSSASGYWDTRSDTTNRLNDHRHVMMINAKSWWWCSQSGTWPRPRLLTSTPLSPVCPSPSRPRCLSTRQPPSSQARQRRDSSDICILSALFRSGSLGLLL